MKIRVDVWLAANRQFLLRHVDDSNSGLRFIPTTKSKMDSGILTYVVIDKPLFMLTVVKYGLVYEEV
jgi:hypothetical protein